MTSRLSLRTLKVAALALALLGLAGLWLAARGAEAPLVTLGQANATLNYAAVRLRGRCVDGPSYDAAGDTLSFWIDDGTGEVRISAYGGLADELVAAGHVPAPGDQVEAAGTLRVRPELLALTLHTAEALEIARAEAEERSIGGLTPADEHQRVRVRGQVRALAEPYPGLTLITLRDATGSVPVAISRDLCLVSGLTPTLALGQALEVAGAVTLYRGSVQIVPASTRDLVVLDGAVALAVQQPIGALSPSQAGALARVSGQVTAVERFSAGIRATLDDGSGEVTLLVWEALADALTDLRALQPGAEVEAQGELALYRGALELVPELAGDLLVVATAAPSPTPGALPTQTAGHTPTPLPTPGAMPGPEATPGPPQSPTPAPTSAPDETLVPIGGITADQAGEELTVEATVVHAASFSHGFRFTLDDGTGQIVLLMWHQVYDDCWDAAGLNLGARVRASGQVADYGGELQIQPGYGGDVQVLEGAGPWAPVRQIGSLSGTEVGTRVMIEGRVLRVSGSSSGVSVSVGDDSGEVVVFLWRNVLDRVARNVGLGTPGSRVRVVGTLGVYRSNLQVQPALPYDVIVLEIP